MNRKQLDTLKVVASENIYKILDALGVDYIDRYQYIIAPCPIHNGDREDAWSWHLDREMWQCFSRGCHDEYGKDIIGFVRGVLKCRFPAAVKFIKDVIGDVDVSSNTHENRKFVKSAKKKKKIIYSEESLNSLTYHSYLEKERGYPKWLIEDYHIGVTGSRYKQMSNRVIIPVRNLNGELVGFTGRTLYKDWKERKIGKWVHSKGFDKADNLFNIDKARNYIEESGTAIITEGPLDVLRLEQYGIKNSVAVFGRKLHNKQISILLSCMANTLILAFDGDTAGKTGAEDAFSVAKSYFKIVNVELRDGDVGDLSLESAKEIFNV